MESESGNGRAGSVVAAGHYVRGDLIAIEPSKEYTDLKGVVHEPYQVKIYAGSEMVTVSYRNRLVIPDEVADARIGERIEVRVYLRAIEYHGKAILFLDGAGVRRD